MRKMKIRSERTRKSSLLSRNERARFSTRLICISVQDLGERGLVKVNLRLTRKSRESGEACLAEQLIVQLQLCARVVRSELGGVVVSESGELLFIYLLTYLLTDFYFRPA